MKIRQNKEHYNIGANIRSYRKACGLTQDQTVAQMQLLGVEISRGTYSQIECGIANVRVEELLAMSRIFNADISRFFDGLSL